MKYLNRISPLPSSQNLIGQDLAGDSQPQTMTVDIKGIGDLMDTSTSEAKPGPTMPIDTSVPKKEEEQQPVSSGPRITGSMVPIVTEDSVTRIKNIQTIYLGK
jgi:hypothetical protein